MVYGRSITIGGSFLAIVVLISAVIFYLSLGPCPQGTFACDNGRTCVPQRQMCNNRTDCEDESDEHPVECGLIYGSKTIMNKILEKTLKRKLLLKQQQQEQEKYKVEENYNYNENENNSSSNKNNNNENTSNVKIIERNEKGSKEVKPTKTILMARIMTTKTTKMTTTTNEISTNNNIRYKNNMNSLTISSNATTITATATNCSIVTYPKLCTCKYGSMLYCGPKAKLKQNFKISAEVTNLMINRNNLTLHENIFANLTNLTSLTLKYNNISHIPLGTFNGLNLERLDVRYNNFSNLPAGGIFRTLKTLQWLFLISNGLEQLPLAYLQHTPELTWLKLSENLLTMKNEKFPRLDSLIELRLDHNRIIYIDDELFGQLNKLEYLDLKWNQITSIHPKAFWNLTELRDLILTGNPLKSLATDLFLKKNKLEALSLGNTLLEINRPLVHSLNVSYINLTGISFENIDFNAISDMKNLKYIVFERFYYCQMIPHISICKPLTDGVSSYQDLLSKPVLRYSAWTMSLITISGNIMVLWGRFIYRDENFAVTMVIRNLALADILMGFYLLTIGAQDLRYRNSYYKIAIDWIKSWQCAAIGALAVTSSEVSMLILAFMSLERFLLIADPFRGHHRISQRNIFVALLAIWIVGIGIAIAPVALWHSSTKFYGTYSGTCFPLHIQEAYPLGWEYSAFMFLGINLCLLLMIAFLYTALLISIYRTRQATPLALLDCEFAVRFFFIVLTDVMCWAPIIIFKIWVFFNYNVSDDIYAWLVVFILPLNSAVNPLLYTFTTPKYRNQILLRGWKKITARKRADPSITNGMATTTATASSNPEESSGRAIPLVIGRSA